MEKYRSPIPSKEQLAYLEDGLAAFIHFGINTYYEQEWGNGKEDITRFHPTQLDCDQWIRVLKENGFKRVILVVKHHDGFVLYPSQYTDYCIKNIPWKNGQGDILKEVSQAASKYDMDLGIYLSPWDAHDSRYSVKRQKEYNEYYLHQLKEVLENKEYGNHGVIKEIWMDGARGEGEEKVEYEFENWFSYIKKQLGDEVCIFSAQPNSVRWIGNESGYGGDPLWQRIDSEKIDYRKQVDLGYLNQGDPYGNLFSIAEADVSIRNGWFYKEGQSIKTVTELMDIYLHSVGKGTVLLLNIPPNKEGKIAEEDIKRLIEFRIEREKLLEQEIAKIEEDTELNLNHPLLFDSTQKINLMEIKENIEQGQKIAEFTIEALWSGKWIEIYRGKTIGFRRLIPLKEIEAQGIRIRILKTIGGDGQLKMMAVYWSEFIQNHISKEKITQQEIYVCRGAKAKIFFEEIEPIDIKAIYRLTTNPITAIHGKHYIDTTLEIKGKDVDKHIGIELDIPNFEDKVNTYDFIVSCENTTTNQKWQRRVVIV